MVRAHAIIVAFAADVLGIEQRCQAGAVEEDGELYFDRETQLVRTRRADAKTGS